MLKFVRKILNFSGEYAKRIKIAFIFSFLEGVLLNASNLLVLYVLIKVAQQSLCLNDAYVVFASLLVMFISRVILKFYFYKYQSGSGHEICADERIKIGDLLKKFSMGYFTKGNLGNITSAITVDLLFFEENGMGVIDKIINAYIATFMGIGFIMFLNPILGLIALAIAVIARLYFTVIEKIGKEEGPIRQEHHSKLTGSIIEYIMGISVIKAFNMVGKKAAILKNAINDTKNKSIKFEKRFAKPGMVYFAIFAVGIGILSFATISFWSYGKISLEYMITILIFSFYVFLPMQALLASNTMVSVMIAALNRYEALKEVPVLENSQLNPVIKTTNIEFKHVSFAYDTKNVLNDINFKADQGTMTAIVGYSGSGKTTIANLIVRFWDVTKGNILLGGLDIQRMSTETLLKNVSMVFQNVYLFKDTVKNNIKFGNASASDEEIIHAAKLARCHDFIMDLPDGYNTVINESGSSLSGGEKQRISIARAILKDAPIILLDEATSSIDPDNEHYIQEAINELVENKTIIVIAHRLSTIMNANQILVIDEGNLVEKGTHNELLEQNGLYKELWMKRVTAKSWKMTH